MKEMHYFKESQREKIPAPDFKEPVTLKILLDFLCDLREWTQADPDIRPGIEKDDKVLYVLYRDIAFTDQSFWQTFGGYLIALRQKWQIDAYGTELSAQEAVELSLEKQGNTFYAVQKTVSGQYADSIRSLCLRVQGTSAGEIERLCSLCRIIDWQSGILAGDWNLNGVYAQERIEWLRTNSLYCYGSVSDGPEQDKCLEALRFPQKVSLWSGFFEKGFDYAEFGWLYDKISAGELNDRTEWELALYTVLNKLNYVLKISEAEFELYNGQGKRCYFSFDSDQNAQKVLLKLLFPLTY